MDNLNRWMREVERSVISNPVVVVLGNKTDLNEKRRVDKSQVETWAEEHNLLFGEGSAYTGEGIVELFSKVFATAYINNYVYGNSFVLQNLL